MDACRLKVLLIFMSVFILGLLLVSMPVNAASRGISVTTKTSSGAAREIQLYSGYHALVIGCGDYRAGWPRLPNPVKDAKAVVDLLKRSGWNVDLLEDPDGNSLKRELNRLVTGPGRDKEKAILVWFSGHGQTIEEADGTKLGYLVPVDAPDPEKDLLGFMERAVSMRQVETVSKQILSKHVLMLFDSCFSGAIFQMVRAKPSAYIEEKVSFPVRQFITAGTETEQVPDRSVFKDVFIQGIKDGFADLNRDTYITGEELGAYLQEKVINYSRKTQHPQYGKINNPKLDKGDFVFAVAGIGAAAPAVAVDAGLSAERKRLEEERQELEKMKAEIAERKRIEDERRQIEAEKQKILAMGKRSDVAPGAGKKIQNSLGMEFVYIRPGSFTMGSPANESGRDDDEKQHQVTLTKGFYLQTTEVTQGQWQAVMGNNPSNFKNCGESCPVESVSWNDAQAFIQKLNQQDGSDVYRLPTEAEWEYAARAGSATAFANGDISKTGCEYDANLDAMGWYCGNSKDTTHKVAQKKSNAWGLYDMHGNVWEWCQDWYGDYSSGSVTDHSGQSSGSSRVLRGGSWDDGAWILPLRHSLLAQSR
ncbi:MAG: SUMF1/EgtB/PvdO family nonheme iron enzyme [Desulfobacterales bacterium]|nr:SUMF1/EgtB/PvdO family nonheme iron enzyme [Desulfobacterales bacterium]